MPNLRHTALLALSASTLACPAQQPPAVLSAQESDPVKLGWMQGAPPPPDKVIRSTDANAFQFPRMRWSVAHMRE